MRGHGVTSRHLGLGVGGCPRVTELAEPDATLVRGQEVHEAAIVAARHAEQRQHRLVAAPRLAQAAPNQLAQIVARDVARQEQRIDVVPERCTSLDERVVEVVGDLAAAIGDRRQEPGFAAHRDRQVLDADDAPGRQPDQLFDDVPELADVAGPPVCLQRPTRLVREAEIARGDREEMLQQRVHVVGPLPERRHVEVDDAQPVQQVLAELAGSDELVQVAIGGGDHAHVDPRLRVVGADRLDLAVLEKPQQQRLHAQAHLADLVEKQRAAMRELELAALVAVGAGEAALDVSEELRLEERFGDAGEVHRHERRQPAAGVGMDDSARPRPCPPRSRR